MELDISYVEILKKIIQSLLLGDGFECHFLQNTFDEVDNDFLSFNLNFSSFKLVLSLQLWMAELQQIIFEFIQWKWIAIDLLQNWFEKSQVSEFPLFIYWIPQFWIFE